MTLADSMTHAECAIWIAAFDRAYLSWPNLAHEHREQIAAQVANAAVEGSRVQVLENPCSGGHVLRQAAAVDLARELQRRQGERRAA